MSRLSRRRLTTTSIAGLALALAATGSAALVATNAGADTAPGYVTSVADAGPQVDVPAPGGALTGLVDGQTVQLDFNATGTGNTITRVELRQCKDGSEIANFTQFRPSTGGQCVTEGNFFLDAPTNTVPSLGVEFQEYETDNFPAQTHVGGPFKVSTGTAVSSLEEEPNITCNAASSCELWARVIQPQNGADSYVHWDLTFAGKPGVPTAVVATPGNGSASVAFAAPANTGNAPITGYEVTATPPSGPAVVATGTTSPIVLPALTNGTAYSVTVKATNTASDGTTHFTSDASAAASVTPVAPPPAITSVSPSSGPTAGGTSVTITGTGLAGATSVLFGNTAAASITSNSATQIVAVSPAKAAGLVDIVVTAPNGTSANTAADNFTFVAPAPPTVTSVTPNYSLPAGGGNVTINGTALAGATSVTFGAANATIVSNTATQIVVTVPPGTEGQVVDVVVTNAIGSSANTAADDFSYFTPAPPAANPLQALITQVQVLVKKVLCVVKLGPC